MKGEVRDADKLISAYLCSLPPSLRFIANEATNPRLGQPQSMRAAKVAGAVARRPDQIGPPTPPFLDSVHQLGLVSLLSQTYGKPVELKLTPIQRPHQNADILAQLVAQKLKDRKSHLRRVLRDAAWKAELPSQTSLLEQRQELQVRRSAQTPLTLQSLNHTHVRTSEIIKDLALLQTSSVMVSAAGRLSKRITANQAQGKMAIRGATAKTETHWLRGGAQKANTTSAQKAGKRRIGSFGVKVRLGHSETI